MAGGHGVCRGHQQAFGHGEQEAERDGDSESLNAMDTGDKNQAQGCWRVTPGAGTPGINVPGQGQQGTPEINNPG